MRAGATKSQKKAKTLKFSGTRTRENFAKPQAISGFSYAADSAKKLPPKSENSGDNTIRVGRESPKNSAVLRLFVNISETRNLPNRKPYMGRILRLRATILR